MEPMSYMRYVVSRNVVMRFMTILQNTPVKVWVRSLKQGNFKPSRLLQINTYVTV